MILNVFEPSLPLFFSSFAKESNHSLMSSYARESHLSSRTSKPMSSPLVPKARSVLIPAPVAGEYEKLKEERAVEVLEKDPPL